LRPPLDQESFEEVLLNYDSLPEPEPLEHLLAGQAAIKLGKVSKARTFLIRAYEAGLERALIDIALTFQVSGSPAQGLEWLGKTRDDLLNPMERIEAACAFGSLQFYALNLELAFTTLDRLWEMPDPSSDSKIKTQVLFHLGFVLINMGQYDRLLKYVAELFDDTSKPLHRIIVYQKAWALMLSGRFDETHLVLNELEKTPINNLKNLRYHHLVLGTLEFLKGNPNGTLQNFQLGIEAAGQVNDLNHLSFFQTLLVFTHLAMGQHTEAKAKYLELNQKLGPYQTHPHILGRLNLVCAALNTKSNPAFALSQAQEGLKFFNGYMHEVLSGLLFKAEANLNLNNLTAAEEVLSETQEVVKKWLGSISFLLSLLQLVPSVRRYLETAEPETVLFAWIDAYRVWRKEQLLEIMTLSNPPEIRLNGLSLHVYPDSVAVLAYLLEHPKSSMPEVAAALFGDDKNAIVRVKNIRQRLLQLIPGLQIRTRRNDSESNEAPLIFLGGIIRFDHQEWLSVVQHNHFVWLTKFRKPDQAFLADLENPWVLQKRQEFKVLLTKQLVF
jgi:hypothetical protein